MNVLSNLYHRDMIYITFQNFVCVVLSTQISSNLICGKGYSESCTPSWLMLGYKKLQAHSDLRDQELVLMPSPPQRLKRDFFVCGKYAEHCKFWRKTM